LSHLPVKFQYLKHFFPISSIVTRKNRLTHGAYNTIAYEHLYLHSKKNNIPPDTLVKNTHFILKKYIEILQRKGFEIQQLPLIPEYNVIVFEVIYLGSCRSDFPPGKHVVLRRLELIETQTLDDLCETLILKSFGWDDPHLYAFFFDNELYSTNKSTTYLCLNGNPVELFNAEIKMNPDVIANKLPADLSQLEEGYHVNLSNVQMKGLEGKSTTIMLKDLHLSPNQSFKFLFDFGDDHVFKIKVTSFTKGQKDALYPLISKSKGEAPKQYPNLD